MLITCAMLQKPQLENSISFRVVQICAKVGPRVAVSDMQTDWWTHDQFDSPVLCECQSSTVFLFAHIVSIAINGHCMCIQRRPVQPEGSSCDHWTLLGQPHPWSESFIGADASGRFASRHHVVCLQSCAPTEP